MVAVLATGGKLTREQVLEGRLWADASAQQGLELVKQGARVLDVRTPGETAGRCTRAAPPIPVDQLEARLAELPNDGKQLLCAAWAARARPQPASSSRNRVSPRCTTSKVA